LQNIEQLHVYDCHQNETELQATENHIKMYTHAHRNCESGLAIIYKHAAHRLVQHRLQIVEIAWTDDSIQAIFFFFSCATGGLHRAVVISISEEIGVK